jgi:hypothetical protein
MPALGLTFRRETRAKRALERENGQERGEFFSFHPSKKSEVALHGSCQPERQKLPEAPFGDKASG